MDANSRRRTNSRNVENLEVTQLTEEERKVLRECRINSMIRGVPAGILSAILTSFAVRSGRFPHLTHWSRFYYGVSFTGGLLFGVASYRKSCLEKIMQLENSVLADQVREYYKRSGIEFVRPHGERKDSEFDETEVAAYNSEAYHEDELGNENVPNLSRLQEEKSTLTDKHKPEETKQFKFRRTSQTT